MLLQLSFRCLARVSHRATLAAVQLHTSAASKRMRFVLSLQLCLETVSVVGKNGGDYGCWMRKPRQMLLATNACQQDRRRVQVATWEPPASPYGLIEEQLFGDPWRLLVACILLNQTTAKGVRPHPPPPPSPPLVGCAAPPPRLLVACILLEQTTAKGVRLRPPVPRPPPLAGCAAPPPGRCAATFRTVKSGHLRRTLLSLHRGHLDLGKACLLTLSRQLSALSLLLLRGITQCLTLNRRLPQAWPTTMVFT